MQLSRFVITGFVFSALAAMAGCSSTKNADELASAESDLKIAGTKYLGPIASGQTKTVHYKAPPNYRSFGISAKGGDQITADIKSEDGDAIGWITDTSYNVLANNDDASDSTFDSEVVYNVPAGQPARSYRIVFREYGMAEANFDVTVSVKSAPATCSYNGQTYQVGDNFPATDTCNTCSCSADGQAACTKKACTCNPATETNRTYVGTPEQCMVIRYSCQVGQVPFSNGCGCGCETPQ
jgi:hypothetical protein